MRRTNRTKSISPSQHTHRRTVKAIHKPALLDRPHMIPGSWPVVCPPGLGRPGIEPPFLH